MLRHRERELRAEPLLAGRLLGCPPALQLLLGLEVDAALGAAGPVGEVVGAGGEALELGVQLDVGGGGLDRLGVRGGRPRVLPLSSDRSPTEAAAMPATPITHAEGTATVSRAERLGGVRRRERDPEREAARGAGVTSSCSSRRETAGSSPVSAGSPAPGSSGPGSPRYASSAYGRPGASWS